MDGLPMPVGDEKACGRGVGRLSRTLSYGNYGIFLIMGNAGFIPSTVGFRV